MTELLSVDVAVARILDQIPPLPAEEIAITNALGRVLAHTIKAEINLPPFANSSMDGYALYAEDLQQASADHPASLRVVMDIPAGSTPSRMVERGEAARIMTGAPLPPGANAIIPVEDTDSEWKAGDEVPLPESVQVFRSIKSGDYVRPEGEDIAVGQTVLEAGTQLRPQDIGMLVALGYASISAIRQPRVAIISTGDELVDAGEPLTPGKIRDVNSHTVAGLVALYGGIPLRLPIARDSLAEVRQVFRDALVQQPDIIISS
ncbi:MAG: molybdopterin molybdotransferase MoeA, partial [Anaerolineae bacterium]|nr:molybdopterin molybdotransferase MoeA [Anaerolineae bacterium]